MKYRKGFKEHYLFRYEIPYLNKKKTLGATIFAQQFRRKKSFYKSVDNQLLYHEDDGLYTDKDVELEMDISYRKNTRHKHKLSTNSN